LLGGEGLECASDHDDVNLERNEFGRKSGEPLGLPLVKSVFDHDVAALDVTEITQSLEEGLAVGPQDAYSSDLSRLLRPGSEWGCDGPGQRGHQEAAAVHYSMT
jgi:hypothetical protein